MATLLPGAQAVPLPPDLLMEIPTDPQNLHVTTENGVPVLNFSTWTVNRGGGALELRQINLGNGTRDVYQRVFNSDQSYIDIFVGNFPSSGGLPKFNDSADYFLREVNEDNSVGAIVGSREKVGYCLVDSFPASNPPPGTPQNAQYVSCGQVLGISVGWIDNYGYWLTNQDIVLTGISSGTYWLQNIIDPLNRLIESNDNNNETHIQVTISTSYSPEMAVLGNGVAIANNDTTPEAADHSDFGYAGIGTGTVTRTFTIQNSGSGSLSLTGVPRVKLSGSSDFAVVAPPPSPVAPSGTTTFQITFQPTGMNATAEVVIINNDSDEASYRFAIRGNANTGNADADGDGMPDEWESLYNLTDPAADEDGDGVSNHDEFIAGNSPRDPASVFRAQTVARVGGGFEISWPSVIGRSYRLYSMSEPSAPPPWTELGQWAGTGGIITATDATAGNGPRFYRITAGF